MNRLLMTFKQTLLALGLVNFAMNVQAAELSCTQQAQDSSRIAVAGGSLTEILYALGEEQHVIAVDSTSTFPEAATSLPQIGYVRDLSAEGLLSLAPTLILAEHDAGPPDVMAQLEAVGVDLLRVPEAFSRSGIEAKIRCVAAAIGKSAAAEQLIAELAAQPGKTLSARGIVTIGINGGAPLVAGRNTSGAGLLAMAGVDNLVEHEGWKPLSREAMVAMGPEFIVISERGLRASGGLEALLNHPAIKLTPAAKQRRIVVMDGMAMLGFGPRTINAAAELHNTLDNRQASTEQ